MSRFERRVSGEERHPVAPALDLQRGERLVPRIHELVVRGEAAQRANHAIAPGERGAAVVGPELALPREPRDDERPQNPQHDLQDDHDQKRPAAVAALAVAAAVRDDVRNQPREEDDERVDDALQQRHGDHVAVGDMGDLVAEHAFYLVVTHRAEQAG